jgi:hypothetical protein
VSASKSAAVQARDNVSGELTPHLVVSACLAFLVFFLWPPQGTSGELRWDVWPFLSTTFVLSQAQTLARLLFLVAIAGAFGSSVRTIYDLATTRRARVRPRFPPTTVLVRLSTGAMTACIAWLTAQALFGITDLARLKLSGIVTFALFVGGWTPDLVRQLENVFDRVFATREVATQHARLGGTSSDATPAPDLAVRIEVAKRQFARTPNDLTAGRALIAAYRDANQIDEAARVFDQLIEDDPDNDELIREKALLYRDAGDESHYIATRVISEEVRAKRLFDENAGKPITIKEVEVKGLSFFGDFVWPLQPGVNVLLGRNGYGKSHLLRAIVAMLLNDAKVTGQFIPDRSAARSDRPSPTLRVDIIKNGEPASTVRNRQLFERRFGGVPVLAIPDMRYIEKSEESFAPLSTVPDLRRQGAEQFIQEKPFQGIILTFLYELSHQFARTKNFDASIFGLIQQSVRQLTDNAFTFHDAVELDNAHFRLLVLTEGNESSPLPLQKASQGTLSVLSMVGLTYRFLKALHPDVREDDIRNQPGIVFIDEIDAHLHPAWQQRILQLFRDTFPNVQFIVTAHTPLVVAGCKRWEVSVLRKSANGFVVDVLDEHFIGASAVTLYRKIFEVDDKDLTYLRFNTLQADRGRLESRREELEHHPQRSGEQQNELDEIDQQLYYLDEVQQIAKQREETSRGHRERQRLEMDNKNLTGQVAELNGQVADLRSQIDRQRPV